MFEVVYYEERKTVRVYVPVPVFFSKKGLLPVVPVQVMKLAGYSVSLARYLFGQQGIRENQYPVHPSRLHSANESSPSGTVHNLNCQLVFRIRIILFTNLDPYSFFLTDSDPYRYSFYLRIRIRIQPKVKSEHVSGLSLSCLKL